MIGDPLGEALVDDHCAKRDVPRVNALRHGHDVRHNSPVVTGEPSAGTAEATHDLIEDEHDAVAVTDFAHGLQVAVGRHDDAVCSRDRLQDEGSYLIGALILDDLLEMRGALAYGACTTIRMSRGTPVAIRVERSNYARDSGLHEPATAVARYRHRTRCRSVIGAIASDDLVPTGVPARKLDRILDRFSAAVGEEALAEVARGHLREEPRKLAALVVRHRRADVAEGVCLLLDRLDDLWMLVTDVCVDRLGAKVEVPLSVVIPEVAASRSRDCERVALRLHRPRVQYISSVVPADLLARAQVGVNSCHQAPTKSLGPIEILYIRSRCAKQPLEPPASASESVLRQARPPSVPSKRPSRHRASACDRYL